MQSTSDNEASGGSSTGKKPPSKRPVFGRYEEDPIRFLPFFDKPKIQFVESYDTEDAKSIFRALNEELSEGEEDTAELQFSMGTFGDQASIDRVIAQSEGLAGYDNKKAQKSFGVGVTFNESFIKGDQSSAPREFNGLQTIMEDQIVDSQTLSGPTGTGDALSLTLLDEAIHAVRDAGIMFCSKKMARKFWAAGRDSSVAGFVNYMPNDSNPTGAGLGAAITFYNGIPIVELAGSFNRDDILPFDETKPGGSGGLQTSLYIAKLGSEGLYGAQLGNIRATDFGQVQGSVFRKWDVEWTAAVGIRHPLAIARVAGILDAPIVK